MCMSFFVRWNWEHLEEQSKILNVVRAVVVVDGEPEHGMGIGILVSDHTGCSSRWDQNRRGKRSGSFGRDQTKIIVTIDILLFEFVQILNTVQTHFFHLLLDIFGEEFGHVLWPRVVFLICGNQVIGFLSEPLANTETNGGSLVLFVREFSGCSKRRCLQPTARNACDSETVGKSYQAIK